MAAGEANRQQGRQAADDDFGLEDKVQDYHRHGGSRGSGPAKKLEGDIGATSVRHERHLEKARPDGTTKGRK